VCLVLAAEGYPGRPRLGDVIEGLGEAARLPDVQVFHAGTKKRADGAVVTAGGRVLGITAAGKSYKEARGRAYEAAAMIRFAGMHFRRDIGKTF